MSKKENRGNQKSFTRLFFSGDSPSEETKLLASENVNVLTRDVFL